EIDEHRSSDRVAGHVLSDEPTVLHDDSPALDDRSARDRPEPVGEVPPARNGPDGEIRLLACLESSNPGLEAERKRGLTRCRDDRLVGGQAEEEAREIEDRRHRMTRRGAGIE